MASEYGGVCEGSVASDPDFAAVCSFLHVFSSTYAIEAPSISELQYMLEDTQEVSDELRELQLKLLRRALKSVKSDHWERSLIKFCHQHGLHKEAWELERFSYKKSSAKVKVKVLKLLFEYQFTCHVKFKNAVNLLKSSELRLEPVGRDRLGRVYWLHTDSDANLRLYREDQDEETWTLIARDREGLVKVINQLKSGEETNTADESLLNEDSNGYESTPKKQSDNEDSNEEFLSPESESENESDTNTKNQDDKDLKPTSNSDDKETKKENTKECSSSADTDNLESEHKEKIFLEDIEGKQKINVNETASHSIELGLKESLASCEMIRGLNDIKDTGIEKDTCALELPTKNEVSKKCEDENKTEDTVDDAIEEPVMLVTGEGSGADCESAEWSVSDEISEPVMYIWGEGCGIECDTGNPGQLVSKASVQESVNNTDSVPQDEDSLTAKEAQDDSKLQESNNGAASSLGESDTSSIKKVSIVDSAEKLKNDHGNLTVTKRLLQENSGASETKNVESTPKKPCIWNVESIVNKSGNDGITSDKNVDSNCISLGSEPNGCDNIKQTRSQLVQVLIKGKTKENKNDIVKESNENTVMESPDIQGKDCDQVDKKTVVEKRKSSLSSDEISKDKKISERQEISSPTKSRSVKLKTKARFKSKSKVAGKPDAEALPSKKLRLESSNDECDKEIDKSITKNKYCKESLLSQESQREESNSSEAKVSKVSDDSGILIKKSRVEKDDKDTAKHKEPITDNQTIERTKKKAVRGKVRRLLKKTKHIQTHSDSDKNLREFTNKHKGKSSNKSETLAKKEQPDKRKRTRNREESTSEEEDEDVTGKRIKMKPKKVLLSARKKVEAKHKNLKDSSEESEEPKISRKSRAKVIESPPKKDPKSKISKIANKKNTDINKGKQMGTEESDPSPVRQSRRIAQLKIREEAERRRMEEIALRELKIQHKKKIAGDGEDEWKASGGEESSASEEETKRRKRGPKWPPSDSSPQASDTESEEPDFERDSDEIRLEFKSDHEFSPESDIEDGEAEPLKRARTLKNDEEGFCVVCVRGDQPEWILLCDDCDAGYHASCLKPVLFLVPDCDWYCPPCQHKRLIAALEVELEKYDKLAVTAEKERKKRENLKLIANKTEVQKKESTADEEDHSSESSSEWSSSDEGTVYRLRERKQLPVSLRAQEYDRLMSSAIKEEYTEPSSTAGNQGRGKDISTIIEAAEEEKMKAEAEAARLAGDTLPPEGKRKKAPRQRRKPRKLNSLEVLSEDDDEVDEDFKETGWDESSESISSDAERETGDDAGSSSDDSLPIRRVASQHSKSRKKTSAESKKKKGGMIDTSDDSSPMKDTPKKKKSRRRQDSTSPKKSKKKRSDKLKQYDAEGNVIKSRVRYGGLSGSDESHDWSPKHRTRQKRINYTEMPNTESEDEMHKPSGKHMADSSDEFRLSESDSSDSRGRPLDAGKLDTLKDLVSKTAVVPLEKLPDQVAKQNADELQAQLNARVEAVVGTATPPRPRRGKGSRGGRGSRGPRGGGRGGGRATSGEPGKSSSDAPNVPLTPAQIERERKRQEKEAQRAEKEAKKQERLKKKEEKEQLKEQKAKEREEKKQAKIALMESKKQRKELAGPIPITGPQMPPGIRPGGEMSARMPVNINQQFADFQRLRQPGAAGSQRAEAPRLQVRPELRAMRPDPANVRAPPAPYRPHPALQREDRHDAAAREGTLSVAGSPQPFKPTADPPSIITRMPHMMSPQYRGPPMYMPGSPYGPPPHGARPTQMMYMHNAHPMDPSPSGGGPVNVNSRPPFPGGYYPRGYPRFAEAHSRFPTDSTRFPTEHPRFPADHTRPPADNSRFSADHPRFPGEHPRPPPDQPRFPIDQRSSPADHTRFTVDPTRSSIEQTRMPQPADQQRASADHPRPPADNPTVIPLTLEPKIKSEIKTEPEASSPPQSPARSASPARDEPRQHPKIKHTETKDRARTTVATRFPLGPYAPQYGPYGPYAPPEGYPSIAAMRPPSVSHSAYRVPPHAQAPNHNQPPLHHGLPPSHHNPQPMHHNPPALHNNPPTSLANLPSSHHNPTVLHNRPSMSQHNPLPLHHNAPASRPYQPVSHHNTPVSQHNPPSSHQQPPISHNNPPTSHHLQPIPQQNPSLSHIQGPRPRHASPAHHGPSPLPLLHNAPSPRPPPHHVSSPHTPNHHIPSSHPTPHHTSSPHPPPHHALSPHQPPHHTPSPHPTPNHAPSQHPLTRHAPSPHPPPHLASSRPPHHAPPPHPPPQHASAHLSVHHSPQSHLTTHHAPAMPLQRPPPPAMSGLAPSTMSGPTPHSVMSRPPPSAHPPSSMHSIPPPAAPRCAPEPLHQQPKMTDSSTNDSVNLIAHNRRDTSSPPSVQRLTASVTERRESEVENRTSNHPIGLSASSLSNEGNLTPMSPAPNKAAEDVERVGSSPTSEHRIQPSAPREGGSVFGGLVSYFSSQQDDTDDE